MAIETRTVDSTGVTARPRPTAKLALARLLCRDQKGQALVEFALSLPLLLLIISGIFAFGIAMHSYLELTEAVAVGGRLLAVSRGQTTDPCALTATAVSNAAPLLTASNLSYTLVLNGTTYSGSSCSSSSTTSGAAGNLVQGSSATITVTYPVNLTVFGNLVPNINVTSQITELVQ